MFPGLLFFGSFVYIKLKFMLTKLHYGQNTI